MSKIIKAINVMVSNEELIANVQEGDHSNEIFFTYDDKHKWSLIRMGSDKFALHYYPGKEDINALAEIDDWEGFSNMISYTAEVFPTREAKQTLNELYTILSEKRYGMDDVLNEIISTDKDGIPF